MSWIKKQYPVGRELEKYPSPAGDFPATVTGHIRYHNLNTWEQKEGVAVRVHAKNEDGKAISLFEDFDPSLLDL